MEQKVDDVSFIHILLKHTFIFWCVHYDDEDQTSFSMLAFYNGLVFRRALMYKLYSLRSMLSSGASLMLFRAFLLLLVFFPHYSSKSLTC